MRIFLDAHLHIYPTYDTAALLERLCVQSGRAPGSRVIALLTERYDCSFFETAYSRGMKAGAFELSPADDSLRVQRAGHEVLTLLPGYQVVTQERIEILTYGLRRRLADGRPAEETIAQTLDSGGLPALAWAPGKWLGGRGGVIRRILDTHRPGELVVCDSSMRPIGWPTPDLMAYARRHGYGWVAGSDPLPFAADLSAAGTYACAFDLADDRPLLTALRNPGFSPSPVGHRSDPVRFALRFWKNARAR